jgi:protein-S-isoprenylcysteine O-methyltransferase Ste14
MLGVSSSMGAELYESHRLVESGPFRYARHPMYLGAILAAFGALLMFRTWTMLVFAPLMLAVEFRARREESLLASEFGESWEAYTKQVPAWIPRIRPRR